MNESSHNQTSKKVLVVGGGIAGLSAAYELARLNVDVDLVEKSNFLGGHAIQFCCKADDECQKCGACSVEKRLKEVIEEPRIKVSLRSELTGMNRNGRFSYTLSLQPLQIDPKKCTNCGVCLEKCPAEGAIVRGYSKNNVPFYAIDQNHCLYFIDGSCKLCQDVCPEKAITLDQDNSQASSEADAIVVATGFEAFDPLTRSWYGYGIHKNVITGLDLERILRQKGEVLRPSDNNACEKIAFIQCVGSREPKLQHGFCSQVCCSYAMRMAQAISHRSPEIKATIFYMDIQNCGKDFPDFYMKCKENIGFVRLAPYDIFPGEEDRLILRYSDEKDVHLVDEAFDIVVLSIGIMPGLSNASLADLLKIDLDEYGFFACSDPLDGTPTSQKGVFLAGTAQAPKNIADSMAQAGQAAYRVAQYLGVMPCPK